MAKKHSNGIQKIVLNLYPNHLQDYLVNITWFVIIALILRETKMSQEMLMCVTCKRCKSCLKPLCTEWNLHSGLKQ